MCAWWPCACCYGLPVLSACPVAIASAVTGIARVHRTWNTVHTPEGGISLKISLHFFPFRLFVIHPHHFADVRIPTKKKNIENWCERTIGQETRCNSCWKEDAIFVTTESLCVCAIYAACAYVDERVEVIRQTMAPNDMCAAPAHVLRIVIFLCAHERVELN